MVKKIKPKKGTKSEQYASKSKSFSVPERVRKEAERGLELSKKHGKGGFDTRQAGKAGIGSGVARASSLKKGRVTYETIKRMLAFFRRHEKYKKEGYHKDRTSASYISWLLWGGDAGYSWARKIVRGEEGMEAAKLTAYSEAESSDDLVTGKPFKTLALGQVTSRLSGDAVGSEITIDLLNELVRVFYERKEQDPVIIDWNHASSPFNGEGVAPPESSIALGYIEDLEVKYDGLYAYPKYTEKGLNIIRESQGLLWSSPEYLNGDVYSRDGGEKIGDAMLLAITLTPRPAQQVNKIETVKLSENLNMDLSNMSVDELRALVESKDAMIRELEAKLKDSQSDDAAKVTPEVAEQIVEEVVEEVQANGEGMDYNKKAEHDDKKDEDKKNAMSELLSERDTQVALLKEQVKTLVEERRVEKRKQAVNDLVNAGKITPAEIQAANDAYDLKDNHGSIWAMFSERPSNQALPLNEVGHSSKGGAVTVASINEKIQQLSEQKGLTYSQALTEFRATNTAEYNQAYGVK